MSAVRGRHRVERADVRGAADRTGTDGADPRYGRRLDFRAPVCAGRRRAGHRHLVERRQARARAGARRVGDDQLRPFTGVEQGGRRADRRPRRRLRRRGRRRRHARAIIRVGGRARQGVSHRRAHRPPRAAQSLFADVEAGVAARHPRRHARDVSADESRVRGQRHQAGH